MPRLHLAGTMAAAFAALLLSILDQTIVASAAAPIARDLHAGAATGRIPWLIAAYTVAGTCVGPLYGKLADRIGARPAFLGSLGLFLAGSALCTLAGSLNELIAFRAIQGLGGGGLMTVAIVVLSGLRRDSGEAPAGSGGNLAGAALVGIGLVLGPTLGGQIVDHASWRWLFAINLPLGGAALAAAAWLMPRTTPSSRGERIDALGAALLAAAAAALLLDCELARTLDAWATPRGLGLLAATLVALALFAYRQLRVPQPLVPLRIVTDRTVRVVAVLQLLSGIGMAGGALYVTFDLQLVHHVSPAATGVRLLPMAAGLACGSLAGRWLLSGATIPLTRSIAISSAAAALAFAALAVLGAGTPYVVLAGMLWLLGAGIGVGLGTEILILQRSVDPSHLGIATASVRFAEELGTSLAAAGMGIVFAARVAGADATSSGLASAVAGAVHPVFAVSAAAMALAAVAALALPIAAMQAPGDGEPAAA